MNAPKKYYVKGIGYSEWVFSSNYKEKPNISTDDVIDLTKELKKLDANKFIAKHCQIDKTPKR